MAEFIITSLVWVLALYGLIEIVKTILISMLKVKIDNNGIYIIIAVKNQEDKIEGFLRSFLFRVLYGKEEYIKDIYVTDLNSTDNTYKILENIEKDNKEIKIYDWQTCKQVIEKSE